MRIYTLVLAISLTSACNPHLEAPQAEPSLVENEINMTDTNEDLTQVDFTSIKGEPIPFSSFVGTVTLVVNTASRCGYTGQYAGLQELHATFKDQGFTVLGVPSNDFGAQEPGSEEEIASFCELNYGVDFPLTQKTKVIGNEQHPFWRLAATSLGEKAEPKWNFHKVLVGRDGRFIQAYPSSIRPADVELVADIERALNTDP